MFSRGTRDPSTPGLRGPHPIRFGGHGMRGPRYSPSSGRRCPFRMCWPSWTWGRCPLRWGLCSPSRRSIGRIEGVSRGSGLERRRAVSSASGRVCVRWQWTTTLAPGLASATEKARPRLFRAPVTRATLPASSWSSVLFHALRRHAGGRPVEIPSAVKTHGVAVVDEAGQVLLKPQPVNEDAQRYPAWVEVLGSRHDARGALEATGGHSWQNLFAHLAAARFPLARLKAVGGGGPGGTAARERRAGARSRRIGATGAGGVSGARSHRSLGEPGLSREDIEQRLQGLLEEVLPRRHPRAAVRNGGRGGRRRPRGRGTAPRAPAPEEVEPSGLARLR